MFDEKKVTLVYKSNMENKNPLSPHLQIYKWHITSLLSITHRIVGVVNILIIISICLWCLFLFFGQNNYQIIQSTLTTKFGKFLIISICWTFSFHILNEIRHLFWDSGFGFDLKTAKITGVLVLVGSLILTILFFLIGRNFF